jgi:hypothetical protein
MDGEVRPHGHQTLQPVVDRGRLQLQVQSAHGIVGRHAHALVGGGQQLGVALRVEEQALALRVHAVAGEVVGRHAADGFQADGLQARESLAVRGVDLLDLVGAHAQEVAHDRVALQAALQERAHLAARVQAPVAALGAARGLATLVEFEPARAERQAHAVLGEVHVDLALRVHALAVEIDAQGRELALRQPEAHGQRRGAEELRPARAAHHEPLAARAPARTFVPHVAFGLEGAGQAVQVAHLARAGAEGIDTQHLERDAAGARHEEARSAAHVHQSVLRVEHEALALRLQLALRVRGPARGRARIDLAVGAAQRLDVDDLGAQRLGRALHAHVALGRDRVVAARGVAHAAQAALRDERGRQRRQRDRGRSVELERQARAEVDRQQLAPARLDRQPRLRVLEAPAAVEGQPLQLDEGARRAAQLAAPRASVGGERQQPRVSQEAPVGAPQHHVALGFHALGREALAILADVPQQAHHARFDLQGVGAFQRQRRTALGAHLGHVRAQIGAVLERQRPAGLQRRGRAVLEFERDARIALDAHQAALALAVESASLRAQAAALDVHLALREQHLRAEFDRHLGHLQRERGELRAALDRHRDLLEGARNGLREARPAVGELQVHAPALGLQLAQEPRAVARVQRDVQALQVGRALAARAVVGGGHHVPARAEVGVGVADAQRAVAPELRHLPLGVGHHHDLAPTGVGRGPAHARLGQRLHAVRPAVDPQEQPQTDQERGQGDEQDAFHRGRAPVVPRARSTASASSRTAPRPPRADATQSARARTSACASAGAANKALRAASARSGRSSPMLTVAAGSMPRRVWMPASTSPLAALARCSSRTPSSAARARVAPQPRPEIQATSRPARSSCTTPRPSLMSKACSSRPSP